jgi:hypothetical protein
VAVRLVLISSAAVALLASCTAVMVPNVMTGALSSSAHAKPLSSSSYELLYATVANEVYVLSFPG